MRAVERDARAPVGFVVAGTGVGKESLGPNNEGVTGNPDALNVDLDDQ